MLAHMGADPRGRHSPDAEFNFGTDLAPVGTRPDTSRHNTVGAQESLV